MGGELLESRSGARHPFALDEAHRPAADIIFADQLEAVPSRHKGSVSTGAYFNRDAASSGRFPYQNL